MIHPVLVTSTITLAHWPKQFLYFQAPAELSSHTTLMKVPSQQARSDSLPVQTAVSDSFDRAIPVSPAQNLS